MSWQVPIYLPPLVLAGFISLVLAYFAARQREKRTAPQVVGILVGASIWAFADAARLASVDLPAKLFFLDLRFLGSTTLVFATFLFGLEYTNRERWLRTRYVAAVAAPFVVTVAVALTSQPLGHDLLWTAPEIVAVDGLRLLDVRFGPWFWLNAAYSYVLLLAVFAFYVPALVREQAAIYRRQTVVITVALLFPWFLNGLYLADFTLVDLTAVGLAVTGAMYYVAIFWFDLLDLIPIARSRVLDHVEHGILVVDPDGRVVDVNDALESILGAARATLLGTPVADVETHVPELHATISDAAETADHAVTVDGEVGHYEIEASSVYSDTGRHLGRVVLIRDVTRTRERRETLRQRTERLERQNEQLDRFADVVSHDLRNPLSVARGNLELAAEDCDSDRLDTVGSALDRMEEIIDDVLALARQSRELDPTESVPLGAVVEAAWASVEAPDASLVIETDRRIEADAGRLQRLLENLLRNAVEHGPDDVTVTVGDCADGFYVEDDGPGIPVDERSDVFTQGYTTRDRGTGFGLSIVDAIVEAHGWSIRVTDGTSGGARFEITRGGDAVARTDGTVGLEPSE